MERDSETKDTGAGGNSERDSKKKTARESEMAREDTTTEIAVRTTPTSSTRRKLKEM